MCVCTEPLCEVVEAVLWGWPREGRKGKTVRGGSDREVGVRGREESSQQEAEGLEANSSR